MEFWRFIFSSFWIWLGFTFLVATVLKYLVDAIKALRNARTIKIYRFEDGKQTIEIQNATRADLADIAGVNADESDFE